MKALRSMIAFGVLTAGTFILAGCTVEAEPPEPAHVRVVPAGYVYGPEYYDHGYYRDGYWYWHDHDGYYRELRADHERREHDWRDRDRYEHHERR